MLTQNFEMSIFFSLLLRYFNVLPFIFVNQGLELDQDL
jgi:hypothetical protein